MSLSWQESDRVFPRLYLPIMEECHKRVFAPWREYLPLLPDFWRHRSNNRQLDAFLGTHIHQRWDHLVTARAEESVPYAPPQHLLCALARVAGFATAAVLTCLC